MSSRFEELVEEVERRAGSELDRLEVASTLAVELSVLGDRLLDHYVQLARREGFSWALVGERLGVTRQAAQQRFVEPASGPLRRFTSDARRVVELAQEEAAALGHNYIGTEHLLLGLLSIGSEPLAALGVGIDSARSCLEEIIGKGKASRGGPTLFSPRAKKVLELSLRAALQMKRDAVSPEHVLVGLLFEGEGVAVQILEEMGASAQRVFDELDRWLGRPVPRPRERRRFRRK